MARALTVFGIDLGTTNSVLARVGVSGAPEVLPTFDGRDTLPSVVLFLGADDYVSGEPARRQARALPEDVCSMVKRRMGEADWRFVSRGKAWSAPAVSSLILTALVDSTALSLDEPVRDVVITVPAYFGDEERRATTLAGQYAGLEVLDVISEPIAAALSYGFTHSQSEDEVALVYDLGGGTFDVAVVELSARRLSVVALDGDHELGGADWDEKLALHLSREFRSEHPGAEDPLDDSRGAQQLLLAAEAAKRRLSRYPSTQVAVEHDGVRSDVTLTRKQLAELTAGLLERTLQLTRSAVTAARARGVEQIDRVLLVGGSSRLPAVGPALAKQFGVVGELADPDLAVAKGAALYGQKKQVERQLGDDLRTRGQLRDGDPLAWAEPADLAAAAQRLAEAYGLPAAQLRELALLQVVNVCSRGFGVAVLNEFTGEREATFLVHRNQPLPAVAERSFGTVVDDQEMVRLVVVEQGGGEETPRLSDAKVLIEGEITDLPPGCPAGSELTITFRMGFDGILSVTAVHEALPDRPLTLSVETSAALSQADVARERRQVAALRRRR